ncbi:MAG: hypothetical protein V4684_09715 [Pseudomonadota bacterium]
MAHDMFEIANASQERLNIILVGGGFIGLFLAALTGFFYLARQSPRLGKAQATPTSHTQVSKTVTTPRRLAYE